MIFGGGWGGGYKSGNEGRFEKDDGLTTFIGLLGGVAVSTFSKTLALVFGILLCGIQV